MDGAMWATVFNPLLRLAISNDNHLMETTSSILEGQRREDRDI